MAISVSTQRPAGAGLIPAAGYVRVSTGKQAEKFSPEVQRAAIASFAAQNGYDLAMVEEDVQRGRVVSRTGYQKVLEAVRAGTVHAVILFMFDRWGRLGSEWVARAHELERAGVDFLSVQEGKEEAGMMRFVRAGMAEEYSRQLAKRVRPSKEASARNGQHHGVTPLGYRRVYPEREGKASYQAGLLVEDPATAWVVRELFARYASGAWTMRTLAQWLNSDPACPSSPRGRSWTVCNVSYILQNPVYAGLVRYNHARTGYYTAGEAATEFVAEGRHEALIDRALFDAVRQKLATATRYGMRRRLPRPDPLGIGILRCPRCGGAMAAKRRQDARHGASQYVCRNDEKGTTRCPGTALLMRVADDALLAQVRRLRGCPWDPSLLQAVVAADPAVDTRTGLRRVLEEANAEMRTHIRRFNALIEDPTPAEVAAHRAVGKEISERIAGLEAQIAALPAPTTSAPDLRALHDQLTRTEVAMVVDQLAEHGDEMALRDLVTLLVDKARIVDRLPESKSKWARAEVEWSADVQVLLDAGLLTLSPDVPRPDYPETVQERRAEAMRRYNARRKAGLVGVVPPARNGLVGPTSHPGMGD